MLRYKILFSDLVLMTRAGLCDTARNAGPDFLPVVQIHMALDDGFLLL